MHAEPTAEPRPLPPTEATVAAQRSLEEFERSLRQVVGLRLLASPAWLLLPPGPVCKFIRRTRLAALPGVQPWCLGVHVEAGALAPVFDLACWCGEAATDSSQDLAIVLISDGGLQFGLHCAQPPAVLNVTPEQDVDPGGGPVPPALQPFLGESALTDLGAGTRFRPLQWLRHVAPNVAASGHS